MISYTYDAFNRRISKISPGKEELFLYQGADEIGLFEKGKLLQLKIGANGGSSSMQALELNGELYYPLKDLFGNVNILLNDKGEVVETYRYTAFGEEEIISPSGNLLTASAVGNPWRYSGKRADPDTGLVSLACATTTPRLAAGSPPIRPDSAMGPTSMLMCITDRLSCLMLTGSLQWK